MVLEDLHQSREIERPVALVPVLPMQPVTTGRRERIDQRLAIGRRQGDVVTQGPVLFRAS